MTDNPIAIADWLIEKHGPDGAEKAAINGVMKAQSDGDNYGLSVWREVRQELAERSIDVQT
jgi:hypothetical protein